MNEIKTINGNSIEELNKMKILLACEETQAVTKELRGYENNY